ncbi:hypothetical protein [Sporosarcina obsidiansis]|uniref:hypothetical protein n=1 Tax=Sporosarcina obsidiansis TaxID=2660748 RepID=UPI00129BD27E|nr:hypothetical protein [Sporosarcina obsidiansis]
MRKRSSYPLTLMVFLLGILGLFQIEAKAETKDEGKEMELVVEYADHHQSLSEDFSLTEVEAREEIAPNVELWRIADNADLHEIRD